MIDPKDIVVIMSVTSVMVALLVSAFMFVFDYNSQYCNAQVCLDEISVAMVSMGLVAVGNPISIGVFSFR